MSTERGQPHAAGLYVWRDSFPGPQRTTAASVTVNSELAAPFADGFTLALQLAPVAVLLIAVVVVQLRRHPRRLLAVIPVVIVIAGAYTYLTRRATVVLGNYLAQTPSYAQTLTGSAPDIFSGSVWKAVGVGAAVCGLVILLAVVLALVDRFGVRREGHLAPAAVPDPDGGPDDNDQRIARTARLVCACFAVTMFATVVAVYWLTGGMVYDRYLMPIVPFAAALVIDLARRTHVGNRVVPVVFAASLATWVACSVFVIDASAANDGVRWRIAKDVVATGIPASEVDGGYEWFGIHQRQPPGQLRTVPSDVPFWEGLFSPRPVCALISYAGPQPPTPAAAKNPMLTRSVRLLDGQRLTVDAFDLHGKADGPCPVLAR